VGKLIRFFSNPYCLIHPSTIFTPVKDSFKTIGVIITIAIYCFAVSVVEGVPIPSEIDSQTTGQEQYFSSASVHLSYHTSQSASSVNYFSNCTAPGFKNLFNEFSVLSTLTNHLLETKFTQYTCLSINFLIQQQKTHIIFPFHYFW